MKERRHGNPSELPPEREALFRRAEIELQAPIEVYRLEERFESLSSEFADITMLDVTKIRGKHYGKKNVFVQIIRFLETMYPPGKSNIVVTPETAILVEPSTGNGTIACSDATEMLGYEYIAVMPDGLPEARYQHPDGKELHVIKTPKEEYAVGMPKKLKELMDENKKRLKEGKKAYICPDHAVNRADITIATMSDIGRELIEKLDKVQEPLRVVISLGNGSSLCAIGEYVKGHSENAKVVTTESFAYGGGYDRFAQKRRLPSYRELFGVDPGHEDLMAEFSAFGTNAPIGIDMPLHNRAFNSDLIDDYVLFADNKVLEAYKKLQLREDNLGNALQLPNYNALPQVFIDTYGNSTLGNIAVASRYTNKGEQVIAMAYDGRENY